MQKLLSKLLLADSKGEDGAAVGAAAPLLASSFGKITVSVLLEKCQYI